MNTMLRCSILLAVCLCSNLANGSVFDLFKSCDEKWRSAWDICQSENNSCYYLDEPDKPNCIPEDENLRYYSEGTTEVRRLLNKIVLSNYGAELRGDNLFISVDVLNGTDKNLHMLIMYCKIIINENRIAFQGEGTIFPSVIPGKSIRQEIMINGTQGIYAKGAKTYSVDCKATWPKLY